MKATKLLLVAALFTGLTSLSFAGPGIDYWNRMTEAAKSRAATEAKAKPEAPAMAKASAKAKPATEVVTTCATCECCAKKA
jgi:phage regulator Rha-like protein